MATTVTTTNIIIGPCTSFQLDGTELGGTSNGVSVEKKQTTTNLECDQIAGAVGAGLSDEAYTIKTELAEATLANLQLAWGLSTAPTTDAQTPATTTLNLGLESDVIEHTLTFVGKAPGGKTRTYSVNRAIAVVSGAHQLDKKKQITFPVEFTIFPDLTKTGAEFGTVADK